jgi:hypothetical protein
MADRLTDMLLDALKTALASPAGERLFRAGKLTGLFPGRVGVSAEAATAALRDGLLEITRTETKGKAVIEWAKLTPRGVEFLHQHESPVRALHELREVLRTTQAGLPEWVVALRQTLAALDERVIEDSRKFAAKLDALSQRVEEALRRLETKGPNLPPAVTATAPWATDALTYLDHRRLTGANGHCPLPELFAALAAHHPELSVGTFHDGLRQLQRERLLRLAPFDGSPSNLPQPEYAILDGATLLYYATR